MTPRASSPQRFPANLVRRSAITPPPPALLLCRLRTRPRVPPKPMGSETVIARFARGRLPRGSVNLPNVYVQIKSFRWEDPMSTQCWILTQQADSAVGVAFGAANFRWLLRNNPESRIIFT